MSPWGSLGCLLRMAGSQHLLTQGPELETCTLRPCMVLLDCLTTIIFLESKDQRRELEWEVPRWATKACPGMLSVQWLDSLEANTNRQATD